jgi:phosphoribosylglycinamide formyltransferase-1
MKIAVCASGTGTNLQALIDAQERGELGEGRIVLVMSDNPSAQALDRAERAGIETLAFPGWGADEEKTALEAFEKKGIELVLLAGFMRILSPSFVSRFRDRIINIHPSLLPSFKGAHGIRDAYDRGVKITGVTLHFVNEELDGGPVIEQEAVSVEPGESIETLEEKIHSIEHRLYPRVVKAYAEGRINRVGNKVRIEESKE